MTWNIDTVDDNLIYQHLEELSQNKLKLSETFELKKTREYLPQPQVEKKVAAQSKTKKKAKAQPQPNSNKAKKKKQSKK